MATGLVISKNVEASPLSKLMCSERITLNSERSPLEVLPQDILIKVLCGVEHEDLNLLFHVSKTIREATLIVKELHFEYNTPKKQTFALHTPIDMENANGFQEIEAPKAQLRKAKSRLNGRKLADITMTLFA